MLYYQVSIDTTIGMVLLLVLIILVGIYAVVVRVSQQSVLIVERFGRYHRALGAGIHVILPIIDYIVRQLDYREMIREIDGQNVITKDNVVVTVSCVLYWKVTEAKVAHYSSVNHEMAVEEMAQTSMRACVGKMTLDEVLGDRETLNSEILNIMEQATQGWGVRCTRYLIKNLMPAPQIRVAMEEESTAERRKRAIILKAEGEKRSRELMSEGEKIQRCNIAEGEAAAIRIAAEAEVKAMQMRAECFTQYQHAEKAAKFMLSNRAVAAFQEVGQSPTNTIVIPANMEGFSYNIWSGGSRNTTVDNTNNTIVPYKRQRKLGHTSASKHTPNG